MRLLHAADLHLDSPIQAAAMRDPDLAGRIGAASRSVLGAIVNMALAQRVDVVVLAGDVFDDGVPDMAARMQLIGALGRLAAEGIPTVLIRGNHDALLDHAEHGPLGEGIHLLDRDRPTVELKGAAFHGLSFHKRHATRSMLPDYPAARPGMANVGVMHTSLGGAEGHDPYAPCGEADLLGHGFDYWALGHIHKRFERRGERAVAVMPGIPQGRHVNEAEGGSVTIATLNGAAPQIEVHPVARLGFARIDVPLEAEGSQTEALQRVRDALVDAARPGCDMALRVTLTGPGAAVWLARAEAADALCREAAEAVDGVHVERVGVRRLETKAADSAMSTLSSSMAGQAAEPGFREQAAQDLAALREALPPQIRDALSDDMLDGLIADGIATVSARLGG